LSPNAQSPPQAHPRAHLLLQGPRSTTEKVIRRVNYLSSLTGTVVTVAVAGWARPE